MAWVLNWVWQGLVIAVVAAAGLRALGWRASARVRYRVWLVTFVAVALLPLLGFVVTMSPRTEGQGGPAPGGADVLRVLVPDLSPWCGVAAWAGLTLFGVVHGVRLLIALRWLAQAKREASPLPRELVEALAPSTGAAPSRRAALVVCQRVRVAAVLGLARPLIALAPRALGSLTRPELTCVVAHERAHLERWDDVVSGAQRLVMAAVGWHPALRWVDRRLHAERERACDDRAVAATGSARAYAACLMRVAELASAREPLMALGVSSSPADVIQRVERLVPPPPRRANGSSRAFRRWDRAVAMTMSLGVATLGLALRQPFETTSPSTATVARESALIDSRAPQQRPSSAEVSVLTPATETRGDGAARTASSFVAVEAAAAQARDASEARMPIPARVPSRRFRPRGTAPATSVAQTRVARSRPSPPMQPMPLEPARTDDSLTSHSLSVHPQDGDLLNVGSLVLAALPVPAPQERSVLVRVVATDDDRGADSARQAGTAWWHSVARAGRHSANATKSTAAGFAAAGRAMGRALGGGTRADAATRAHQASLETPGARSLRP